MKIAIQEFSTSSTNDSIVNNITGRSESGKSTSELITNNKSVSLQAIKYIVSDVSFYTIKLIANLNDQLFDFFQL